jgi:hypothetical protein
LDCARLPELLDRQVVALVEFGTVSREGIYLVGRVLALGESAGCPPCRYNADGDNVAAERGPLALNAQPRGEGRK